jgi:hypothetical protein
VSSRRASNPIRSRFSAASYLRKKEDPQQRERAKARLRRARRKAQSPTREYNFVDPDSHLMMDTRLSAFAQAYNAQVAADGQAQVIVAAEITQTTTDSSDGTRDT